MKGWKTWVTAAGFVVYGVVGYALDIHDADACAKFVLEGFALIGIGHKIEKAAR